MKILVTRWGAIGDVVLTTGLVHALHKQGHEVHYLTFKTPSIPVTHDNRIKKLYILEKKSYKYLFSLAKKLRHENYDLFINLHPSTRSKFLALLSMPKKILTYKKSFKLHAVENFFSTAKKYIKNLELDNNIYISVPESNLNLSNKVIGFNTGATLARQGRRWPIERWKELTKLIIENTDYDIVLNGAKEDKKLSEQLLEISPRIKSYCGELSLEESISLISKCMLFISGDTGPLHIATATGVNCLGIYGSAPVTRSGPYGEKSYTIQSKMNCAPCNRRKCKYLKKGGVDTPCMGSISADEVFKFVIEKKLI